MEKLSGILPTNARIRNVDLASGPAVRPGTPSFGRPLGLSPKTRLDRLKATQDAAEAAQVMKTDKVSISPQAVELAKTKEALNSVKLDAVVESKTSQVPVTMEPVMDVKEKTKPKAAVNVKSTEAVELPAELHEPIEIDVSGLFKAEGSEEASESAYPEEVRDMLNTTSIVGRIINNIPEATDSLVKGEEEEI